MDQLAHGFDLEPSFDEFRVWRQRIRPVPVDGGVPSDGLAALEVVRTEVSVGLLRQADGALVSRSQGKRLVAGLERFTSVVFDLAGVDTMQQGFADEVFRVWVKAHPEVTVSVRNVAEPVGRMLLHVGFSA